MKHMLIMRATQEAAMGAYNESLMKAGVMVACDGLASEAGYVVEFGADTDPDRQRRPVRRGPRAVQRILDPADGDGRGDQVGEALPLGPGSKFEVRRVTDESGFEAYADNEFMQKEADWRDSGGSPRRVRSS